MPPEPNRVELKDARTPSESKACRMSVLFNEDNVYLKLTPTFVKLIQTLLTEISSSAAIYEDENRRLMEVIQCLLW